MLRPQQIRQPCNVGPVEVAHDYELFIREPLTQHLYSTAVVFIVFSHTTVWYVNAPYNNFGIVYTAANKNFFNIGIINYFQHLDRVFNC